MKNKFLMAGSIISDLLFFAWIIILIFWYQGNHACLISFLTILFSVNTEAISEMVKREWGKQKGTKGDVE